MEKLDFAIFTVIVVGLCGLLWFGIQLENESRTHSLVELDKLSDSQVRLFAKQCIKHRDECKL